MNVHTKHNSNKFVFEKVTTDKVEKIINNIDIKKATGADGIPAKIIKCSLYYCTSDYKYFKYVNRSECFSGGQKIRVSFPIFSATMEKKLLK
jgi:hypothetical protein